MLEDGVSMPMRVRSMGGSGIVLDIRYTVSEIQINPCTGAELCKCQTDKMPLLEDKKSTNLLNYMY